MKFKKIINFDKIKSIIDTEYQNNKELKFRSYLNIKNVDNFHLAPLDGVIIERLIRTLEFNELNKKVILIKEDKNINVDIEFSKDKKEMKILDNNNKVLFSGELNNKDNLLLWNINNVLEKEDYIQEGIPKKIKPLQKGLQNIENTTKNSKENK